MPFRSILRFCKSPLCILTFTIIMALGFLVVTPAARINTVEAKLDKNTAVIAHLDSLHTARIDSGQIILEALARGECLKRSREQLGLMGLERFCKEQGIR